MTKHLKVAKEEVHFSVQPYPGKIVAVGVPEALWGDPRLPEAIRIAVELAWAGKTRLGDDEGEEDSGAEPN